MTRRPPLVGAEIWLPVMESAGHRCTCTGACGQKHSVGGGRCDTVNGPGRRPLLAAPLDPPAAAFPGAATKSTPLTAWCHDCYGKAARAAAAVPPVDIEPLFDLDAIRPGA